MFNKNCQNTMQFYSSCRAVENGGKGDAIFSVINPDAGRQGPGKTAYLDTFHPVQSANFRTFDCSSRNSPNLLFDGLLLLKVYEV